MTYPTKVPRKDHVLVALRYLVGEPVKLIAYDYGCSTTVIGRIARRHGAPRRNKWSPKCPPHHPQNQSSKSPSTSLSETSGISSAGPPTGPRKSET